MLGKRMGIETVRRGKRNTQKDICDHALGQHNTQFYTLDIWADYFPQLISNIKIHLWLCTYCDDKSNIFSFLSFLNKK